MAVLALEQWSAAGVRVSVPERFPNPVTEMLRSEERVALDLHAGGEIQRGNRAVWETLNGALELKPGECVRVRTREKLETSVGVFGMVCSRASLAADGVYVSNLKVDPNFVGYLELAVFNASRARTILPEQLAFANVFFMRLDRPLENAPIRIPTPTAPVTRDGLRGLARRLLPYAATVAVSVTATSGSEAIKALFS